MIDLRNVEAHDACYCACCGDELAVGEACLMLEFPVSVMTKKAVYMHGACFTRALEEWTRRQHGSIA